MYPLRGLSWSKGPVSVSSRPSERWYRPWLERLESREAPAVFNVPNGVINMAPMSTSPGVFTAGLVDAITAANTNMQADTINLAGNGLYQFAAPAAGTMNLIATPFITLDTSAANSITINGNGSTLQATGTSFRMFWVSSGVLFANNLTIANASIPPSCCGGAGMVVGTSGTAPPNSSGTVDLTNVTFNADIANNAGAALYMYGPNSSTTLTNCTFTNNIVQNGGAAGGTIVISGPNDTLTITGSSISNNNSAGPAGGIAIHGTSDTVNITNSVISGNTATGNGGGLYVNGTGDTLTLNNSTVAGNTSGFNGGGGGFAIAGTSNTVNVVNSTISGNQEPAAVSAGAFFFEPNATPTLNITNSIITGNSGGYSGGIYCKPGGVGATVSITGSTIDSNTGNDAYGAGIGVNMGVLNITNSTIANNIANKGTKGGSGRGAGLWIHVSTVNLRSTTISGNQATSATNGLGGGIYRYGAGGILNVTNCLIAGNTAAAYAPDFRDALGNAAVSFSLIGNTQGDAIVNGTNNNIVNPNPGLGPLQFNGGFSTGSSNYLTPLRTVALLTGSPAIDKGSNIGAPATDERGVGFNRIINGTIDIGSFEFQPPTTTTTLTSSLNPSNFGQSVTFTATVTPTAAGSNALQGTVTFLDNGTPLATVTLTGGTAVFTTATQASGSNVITAQYNGFAQGNYTFSGSMAMVTQTVVAPPTPPPPPPPTTVGFFSTGADAGSLGVVNVYNAQTQQLVFTLLPFGSSFTGGVRVAVGDVNGDGVPDIICGAGPGTLPEVIVFDGRTQQPLFAFFAFGGANAQASNIANFSPFFTGGVYVAAGDVNGDGFADVIVGAGEGGGPQVQVYSGKTGTLIANFYAFGTSNFRGGVRVAAGDVNGDGRADIICGAGAGGGPQVQVYDGANLNAIANFYAFTASFTGGVFVGAGNVSGGKLANVICGAGSGGGPQVTVFDASTLNMLASFFAYNPTFTGGVHVTGLDVNGDGRADIVTGPGRGGLPELEAFDGQTLTQIVNFFTILSVGGIYVG